MSSQHGNVVLRDRRAVVLTPGDRRRPRIAAVLAALFAVLTAAVRGGWVQPLDTAISRWAVASQQSLLAHVAVLVTDAVTPQFLVPCALVLTTWPALRCRQWLVAGETVARLALLTGSVLLLKGLVARPGPSALSEAAHGGAFPSGHTTTSLVCGALLLSALTGAARWRMRPLVLGLGVGLVSASLVYMNFHWFSDVIGGWLLGGVVLILPLPRRLRLSLGFPYSVSAASLARERR